MKRERTARAALHAFPATVRAAYGEEMLGTLLDVSATSRTRFVLELVGFVRSGMKTRATQTAKAGAQRVVADGVCLAAVWLLMLFLASDLGDRIRGGVPGYPSDRLSPWALALLGGALALALVGYDRTSFRLRLTGGAWTTLQAAGELSLTVGLQGPARSSRSSCRTFRSSKTPSEKYSY